MVLLFLLACPLLHMRQSTYARRPLWGSESSLIAVLPSGCRCCSRGILLQLEHSVWLVTSSARMCELQVKTMSVVHTQAPEGTEHENYKKGQHLRGVDAANAERVRAEMVSAAY